MRKIPGRIMPDKIRFHKNREAFLSCSIDQRSDPSRLRLVCPGPGASSDYNPIKPAFKFNFNAIEQRFKGYKSDFGLNFIKIKESFISHSLICCCASDPTVMRIRRKFKQSLGIFGQKLENILRAFSRHFKNSIYPALIDPIPKQLSNRTDKNHLHSFLKRLIKPISMKGRFKRSLKSFRNSPGIAIRTGVQASCYRIPAKISPFNRCFIHTRLTSPIASEIHNDLTLDKALVLSHILETLQYHQEQRHPHNSLISEEQHPGTLPIPRIPLEDSGMALSPGPPNNQECPSRDQHHSGLNHNGLFLLNIDKLVIELWSEQTISSFFHSYYNKYSLFNAACQDNSIKINKLEQWQN